MREAGDTYKYQLKVGKKVVHIGHTTDLQRREKEHQKQWPDSKIYRMGRRTTREGARQWEHSTLKSAKIEPKELRTLSHDTRSRLLRDKEKIMRTLNKR